MGRCQRHRVCGRRHCPRALAVGGVGVRMLRALRCHAKVHVLDVGAQVGQSTRATVLGQGHERWSRARPWPRLWVRLLALCMMASTGALHFKSFFIFRSRACYYLEQLPSVDQLALDAPWTANTGTRCSLSRPRQCRHRRRRRRSYCATSRCCPTGPARLVGGRISAGTRFLSLCTCRQRTCWRLAQTLRPCWPSFPLCVCCTFVVDLCCTLSCCSAVQNLVVQLRPLSWCT